MTLRDVGSGVAAVRWSPDGRRISAGGPQRKTGGVGRHGGLPSRSRLGAARSGRPGRGRRRLKAPKPAATVSNAAKVLLSPEWKWTEFENLGPAINSPHGEFEPSLSADGLTLLFHSDRPGGHGGYDIWMSVRESPNQPWRPATNLGPIVNSDANDEGPELSHDGLTLYFSSNRRDGDIDLWCTTRDSVAEPWREPELVRGVNSWRTEVEPALSSDGLTLVFASTRDPSLGVFDLWMCRRDATDDDWSKPSHLSASINADQWQGSPSLSSDEWGSIMVFHSYDQLKISIRDSNESRFTTMYNLSDDGRFDLAFSPCLSPDGKSLYFRSTNEDGNFDLWVTRRVKR